MSFLQTALSPRGRNRLFFFLPGPREGGLDLDGDEMASIPPSTKKSARPPFYKLKVIENLGFVSHYGILAAII